MGLAIFKKKKGLLGFFHSLGEIYSVRLDILLSLPEIHHIRCLNLFIPIINAIKASKNALSILYKIKIQNPRLHVIICFTTESTKATYYLQYRKLLGDGLS